MLIDTLLFKYQGRKWLPKSGGASSNKVVMRRGAFYSAKKWGGNFPPFTYAPDLQNGLFSTNVP